MRRLLKIKVRVIVLVVLVLVGFYILNKINVIPSIGSLFKQQPVVIDETPIVVREVRAIGELITAVSSDEVVVQSVLPTRGSAFVQSVNRFSPVDILPSADKKIVLIGRGKIMAGTNFNALAEDGLRIKEDTVWVTLPKATIIDAIINPSDFETFEEKGRWTNEEVNMVKQKARQMMIDRAIANNLLAIANKKAESVITQFLLAAGYKTVRIELK